MRFSVHQPVFMPWPGFAVKAALADVFVLLDTVQFPRGFTWVNRNRIKGPSGAVWIALPVLRKGQGLQRIDQVEVAADRRWRHKFLATLEHCYGHSPFFPDFFPIFEELCRNPAKHLLEWNLTVIDQILARLGVDTGCTMLSALGATGKGTDLIALIGQAIGAEVLVAPAAAKAHLDMACLARAGICVEWVRYRGPVYPQLWGGFVEDLSALDILFNCGPRAWDILARAQRPPLAAERGS